jgi:murein L,D-transpeptidase YafK
MASGMSGMGDFFRDCGSRVVAVGSAVRWRKIAILVLCGGVVVALVGVLFHRSARDSAMSDGYPFPVIPPPAVDEPLPSHLVSAGKPRAQAASARVRMDLEAAMEGMGLRWGDPVFLRAFKEDRVLEVFVRQASSGKFLRFRSYGIAGQSGALGPKLREGDKQVPEGFYDAGLAAMRPDSVCHLAINTGYPNEYDRAHERTGSFIMIHGVRGSIGCLAMSDARIEEIYCLCDAALAAGQKKFGIHIFPFRMTPERMERSKEDPWFDFWTNLKEGYDLFENKGVPPKWEVRNLRYSFR